MEVVSESFAKKEVEKWLDYKKISRADRETFKDHIDSLVSGIVEGTVSIDGEFNVNVILNFPIQTAGEPIEKLTLKPRILARDITDRLEKMRVSSGNADGRLKAILCELSGQSVGVIGMLDTTDQRMCHNVVVFFL